MAVRLYVSMASQDAERCKPLLDSIRSWSVEYWLQSGGDAEGALSPAAEKALRSHDMLLRICTPALQESARRRQEADRFRALHAADGSGASSGSRVINLILDAGYVPEPGDADAIRINGAVQPMGHWLPALRQAIKPYRPKGEMDRRLLTAIIGVIVVALVLLSAYSVAQVGQGRDLFGHPLPTPTPSSHVVPALDSPAVVAGIRFARHA
jgi:hypothetical protein